MDVSRKVMITRHRRNRRLHNRPNFFLWVLRIAVVVVLAVVMANAFSVLAAAGTVFGIYSYFAKDLPDPRAIETEQEEFETTKIYDRTGEVLLYEFLTLAWAIVNT